MGCTSSAANIPETQPSTTDGTENKVVTGVDSREPIKENDIIYSSSKEWDQRQGLPDSEITNNQMKIVSNDNNKSTENNFTMELESKDEENITPTENRGETENIIESPPLNDSLVSLKVVIEKVISENVDQHEQKANVIETRSVDLDRQIIEEMITESNVSEGVAVAHNDDEAKESPSPTQSEDSRATRWEALADIAAELPPSLAVDPLTGQIYSLAK